MYTVSVIRMSTICSKVYPLCFPDKFTYYSHGIIHCAHEIFSKIITLEGFKRLEVKLFVAVEGAIRSRYVQLQLTVG